MLPFSASYIFLFTTVGIRQIPFLKLFDNSKSLTENDVPTHDKVEFHVQRAIINIDKITISRYYCCFGGNIPDFGTTDFI